MSVSSPSRIGSPIPGIAASPPQTSLRKNISWTMLGNVVYAASQWGVVIVLVRLGSPEAVGRLALGLAVTAPIMLFCNLQLRTLQATDAHRGYEFGDYFGLRLISTLIAFALIYVAAQTSGYSGEALAIILWLTLAKGIESFSDLLHGTLHRRESMDRIAQSQIVRGIVSLLVFAAVYAWTQSVAWACASLAGSWLLVLLAMDIPLAWPSIHSEGGRIRPRFMPSILARLSWTALPMALVTMLTSVETNLPRYVLERSAGERELGIFASLAYLVFASLTLIQAVNQSALPRLARLEASGDTLGVRRLMRQLLLFGSALGGVILLGSVILGGPVLSLLYGPEYRPFTGAFVWVAAAAAVKFAVQPLAVALRAGQQFWVLLGVHVFSTLAMLGSSLWLIPSHGINGAAISLFLSSLLFAFLQIALMTWRRLKRVPALRGT